MKLRIVLVVIVALLHTTVIDTRQGDAQGSTTVALENVAALVSFGERITFVATVKSPLPGRDASIVILDEEGDSTDSGRVTVQASVRTEYQYNTGQNNLRPFGKV